MPSSPKLFFGEIDRLSGSGNAIVTRKHIQPHTGTKSQSFNEINLGPLPEEIVGEEVPFAYKSGTYGLCLGFEYIDEEYVNKMAGHLSFDLTRIQSDNLFPGADVPDLIDSDDIFIAEHLFSLSEGGLSTDILDDQYVAKIRPVTDEDWSCIGLIEGPAIQTEIPIPVMVTEIHSAHINARGALPRIKDELPDIGETIKATTGSKSEIGTFALYETDYDIPILLEDTQYPSGEIIKLQITGFDSSHATGKAVVSADDFDTIDIADGKVPSGKRQSRTRVIEEQVPIDIEPVPEGTPTTAKVVVTGEGEDALIARWDIQGEVGPIGITKGDEITLDIQLVDGESCVGYYNQFPICVNFDMAIPAEFENETLTISIQTVYPDKAIAKPKWITDSQESLEVRVVGSNADSAIAIRAGCPVQVPNASIVTAGDRFLVGLSKSTKNDVPTATIAARSVFKNTDGPYLIRLPKIRGDVMKVAGTPAKVDHLPDVNTSVTLGVAEVNEDHIIPTVTALPEIHLPDEGAYISVESERISDRMAVGIGEELPMKLPTFLASQGETITARVLECRSESLFGIVGSRGDDTDESIGQLYEQLQLASLALGKNEYQDGARHLKQAHQGCPSEFPVLERLLAVHETILQSILAIQADTGFDRTISMLSQEANRLREFKNHEDHSADVRTLLSAREEEIRAAEKLLTVMDEVGTDTTSDLQAIARGVSAKAPVLAAVEHLSTAKGLGAGSPFEKQILSLGTRSVISEFRQSFPGIVDELQPFDPPKENVDWFQHLLPEGILGKTDVSSPSSETGGQTWKRPAVPETMGISPVTDTHTDYTNIKETTANQSDSKPDVSSKASDSDTHDVETKSGETTIDELQTPANDAESLTTDPGPESGVSDEEVTKQVSKTGAESNELETKTETGNQTSPSEDTLEDGDETTSKNETSELETPEEPLPIPDSSPQLRELRKKAEAEASQNPEREHVGTTTNRYRRSSAIREYALKRADGFCELCGEEAPFVKPNGDPFLEVHHVDELGAGGADHPSLVGALCPNCHKEVHHGEHGEQLNKSLRKRLENGLGGVGAVSE